jgi:two-component system, NtrC family, sensor histidine kinase PilS
MYHMTVAYGNFLEKRQWRMLFIYNLYRMVSIVLLFVYYFISFTSSLGARIFIGLLILYMGFSVLCFYFGRIQSYQFEKQVFIAGTVDVTLLSILLVIIGNLYAGYGILLNVTIAYLSILIPGRIAIFFAALASSFILYGNFMSYLEGHFRDIGIFFYSGVYGAGFFATALTAWYLANWVRTSEQLAVHRSNELAGMQRLNEYIVGRLHSGIIYVDERKQIKLINTAARTYFNLDEIGQVQTVQNISTELNDKYEQFLVKTIQNEGVAQAFLQKPYLRVHFFSTEIAKKTAVLIILEDMSYISQQAQQLKLASLGRFSASIAHELRNPLGAISHAAQLLGGDVRLTAADTRLKQLISNNCERMNGVIKNVLQLTRRQQSHPQLIDIGTFLTHFKEDFCHTNQCNMTIKLSGIQGVPVFFDTSQLEQIMINLCDNAMKYGRDKQGDVSIVAEASMASNKAILKIYDFGPGIPLEHKESIFEPFFTTTVNGTGMGLFIAKDLCDINQAQLNWVKTNKGCCFTITFNLADELLI